MPSLIGGLFPLNLIVTGGSPPLVGLPPFQEAEVCERTSYKNSQPTHPERYAQAADLYPPTEDDPQEMRYRHDEKQHGSDRHVGFSIHFRLPFLSYAHHDDSSTTTSCSMAQSLLAWPGQAISTAVTTPLVVPFWFGSGCLGSRLGHAAGELVSRFSEVMRH
jgi:hypothetical protein